MTLTAGTTGNVSVSAVSGTTPSGYVYWSSNNSTVATVSQTYSQSATITAVSAGTATITATWGGYTASCAVTVTASTQTITLDRSTLSFTSTSNTPVRLIPTVRQNGSIVSNPTVTWRTSNSSVATVDVSGYVRPVGVGTATITASLANGASATCAVTVSYSNEITVPSSASVSYGGWNTVTASKPYNSTVTGVEWSVPTTSQNYLAVGNSNTFTTTTNFYSSTTTSASIYGRASGRATLQARAIYSNGQYGTYINIPVTISGSGEISVPSSASVAYNGWTGITASKSSASTVTSVEWSVPSTSQSYLYISQYSNPSSSQYGSTATTYFGSSNTTNIYVYGRYTGRAYLYATPVYSNGTKGNPVTITVNVGNSSFALAATPSESSSIYLNYWNGTTGSGYYYQDFSVDPRLNSTSIYSNSNYTIYYTWTLNGYTVQSNSSSYNSRSYRLTADNQYLNRNTGSSRYNTLVCRADVYSYGTTPTSANVLYSDTATWTVYTDYAANTAATATVYNTSARYNLGDTDDAGGSSIVSQLENYFYRYSGYYNYTLESVTFNSTSSTYGNLSASTGSTYYVDSRSSSYYYNLADVYFVPSSRSGVGTATFSATANVYYGSQRTSIPCTIAIRVTNGTASGGDVTYNASVGDSVYFDSNSFQNFWSSIFSGGSLTSVRFNVSGGTLRTTGGGSVGTSECYVSARSSQIDLDDVYFTPSTSNASRAGTIRFTFTATGTSRNSSASQTRAGTVVINYLAGSPKDITYTVNNAGSVSLNASDFTAAYREATGTAAPSGMTVVFQSVPRNGTLTYTDSSRGSASKVTLSSSTIKTRSFTTRSTGSNQINDITYTGTSGSDTIEYIAYSGTTAMFSGKVVFNAAAPAPTNIVVAFTSVNGNAAAMSSTAFTTANATVMAKTSYMRFTAPGNGSLLMNGSTSAVGVNVYPSSLGSVSYRPKAGFNGSDRCMFMAYDSTGNLVGSGTVNFAVSGNPTTTTPTTPNNGGASSVSQFKDVKADAWYREDLISLMNLGIIKGKSATSFAPTDTVNYGEALKMVLVATGHQAAEGTGSNWAINYKNLAVSNGWISNDIVLSNPISRNAMAELTAKVLGVSASSVTSETSPFADNANGYAAALYYTNPQIFKGNPSTTGGRPLFKTNDPLLRQEVCAVINRVYQYYTSMNSNQMPDGI